MIKAQYINLNMIPSGVMPVLYCSQYDVGRPLGMVVYNGSEAVDLSTYTVTIEGTRTDGTPITAAVTTDGNVGAFETTATMTNVPDFYKTQLVLTDGSGKRVASIRFMMKVNEAAMNENSEGIQEDASLYQQYTGTVQTLISAVRADLLAEANRAQAAEAAEASARQAADATLQSAITSEASTRAAADQNLQAQVNQIIAPSGEAPSAAEVQNARIGADNVTYPTLGDAIRGQVTNLKKALNELFESIDFTFRVGTLNSVYGTYDSTNLTRLTSSYHEIENIIFKIPTTYNYNIFFYSTEVEQHLSGYISNTEWLSGQKILGKDIAIPNGASLFRFIVRYPNNSAITVNDFTGYYILKTKDDLPIGSSPNITYLCRDGMAVNDVPPNSKYAIKATAINQYDKIRFSVTKTTDGEYVAVHDTTINNLAVNLDGTQISETIYTANCTLAELNGYDWGLKYGYKYVGMHVPMLDNCLKYASIYNLTVALDFKWTVTDSDIEAISAMLAKYGQLDAILFAVSITNMQKFQAKSKKLSYLFAGTLEQMQSQAGSLRLLLSGYNKIYLAYRPLGTAPTTDVINLAMTNGFDIMYSPIEGIDELTALGFDKGVTLMECHYISNIKTTVRDYANSLV